MNARILCSTLAISLLSAAPALALPSQASFAYTGGPDSFVELSINGGSVTRSAVSRGWITQGGDNNGGDMVGNYIVGVCGSDDICGGDDLDRHNYFVFDLDGVGFIEDAVLLLTQPLDAFGDAGLNGYISNQPSHVYSVWDSSVAPDDIGGVNEVSLFNDLASGVLLGDVTVTEASNGTSVAVAFNSDGLSVLRGAGSGRVALGGALDIRRVDVPAPGALTLMVVGLGVALTALRRRRAV